MATDSSLPLSQHFKHISPSIEETPVTESSVKNVQNHLSTKSPEDGFYYPLNDGREKHVYIFNHQYFKKFQAPRKPSNRIGTDKDNASLKKCFEGMGFNVTSYQDLTREEIFEKIKTISNLNYKEINCLAVVVLTHGDKNGILCAADKHYSINGITKPIVGSKTLAGIPKLFVFQACRGNETDDGHELDGPSNELPELIMNADYLCLYSSVENYVSWREANGSWLIQTLCHIIEKHWKESDLVDILTRVNRIMAYEKITDTYVDYDPNSYLYHNKKGMSEFESTLTKFFNFNK